MFSFVVLPFLIFTSEKYSKTVICLRLSESQRIIVKFWMMYGMIPGRHGGLMLRALDSTLSGTDLSLGWNQCIVFLDKKICSHGASHHPDV